MKPKCEKNSCQDLEYRTQLADRSDFCEPCKELSGWSMASIKRHKKPTKGVCHRLYPPPPPKSPPKSPPPRDSAEGTAPGYESPLLVATRRRRLDTPGMSEATATGDFETPRSRRERDSASNDDRMPELISRSYQQDLDDDSDDEEPPQSSDSPAILRGVRRSRLDTADQTGSNYREVPQAAPQHAPPPTKRKSRRARRTPTASRFSGGPANGILMNNGRRQFNKKKRRRRPVKKMVLEMVERKEVEDQSQQGEQADFVDESVEVQLEEGIMNAQWHKSCCSGCNDGATADEDEAIEKTQCPRRPHTLETVDDNVEVEYTEEAVRKDHERSAEYFKENQITVETVDDNDEVEYTEEAARKDLERSTGYYIENPNDRNEAVDVMFLDGITSVAGAKDKSFIPKGGQSKAARFKRQRLLQNIINGAAHIMNRLSPTKARNEIFEQAEKMKVPLKPIKETGYFAADMTPCEEQGAEVKEDAGQTKLEKQTVDLLQQMGRLGERCRNINTVSERRPLLAEFADFPKKAIEAVIGKDITSQEYQNIKMHAKYPGPYEPVPKMTHSRSRLDPELLDRVLRFLDAPTSVQKYAYGTKVVPILEGTDCVELSNVDRLQKSQDLAARFIRTMDEEITAEANALLPPSEERCQKSENKTFRRCMCKRGHTGKCKFTKHGSASLTAINEVVKFLTGGDCKTLSGLDDVKVLKGTDNWKRLKHINDHVTWSVEDRRKIGKRLTEQELYYQTDYVPHLKSIGDMQCNCLTCGFCDKGKTLIVGCHGVDPTNF
jgi:hypothetical protein